MSEEETCEHDDIDENNNLCNACGNLVFKTPRQLRDYMMKIFKRCRFVQYAVDNDGLASINFHSEKEDDDDFKILFIEDL